MALVHQVATAHGYDPERLGVGRIRRACQRRSEALGLASPEDYSSALERDPGEPARLFEELAVCETWFFRQSVAMFAVARHLAGLGRPVRVLSAPCATGEEPYSIAIALLDAGLPAAAVSIDAVDLCDHALATARAARYTRRSFRGAHAPVDSRRFVAASNGESVVRDDVARTVRFIRGDLRDASLLPPARYDAVFCCHLLIYLGEAARDRVAANLTTWMAPGARLVVGPPEASALQQRGFSLLDPAGPVLERARAANAAPASRSDAPAASADVAHAPSVVPVGPRVGDAAAEDGAIRAHLGRARRLADAGHTGEAAAICAQLRELGVAERAEVQCLVGVIELACGRRVEARAAFHRAATLDPAHAEARHFLTLLNGPAEGRR